MIKAILFDMDGVLVNSPSVNWKGINSVLEKIGKQVPEKEIKKYMGRKLHTQLEMIGVEKENINAIHDQINSKQIQLFDEELKPDKELQEFLDKVKTKYKLAVATSSPKDRTTRILSSIKIIDKFDSIISSDQTMKSKPAPDIFLKAAKEVNALAKECVVIEDAPSGIKAGKAANMIVIAWKTSYFTNEDLCEADTICSSLKELEQTIKEF